MIEYGHAMRTTHATTSNDTSSRSHAICTIHIRDKERKRVGSLLLVDLAVCFALVDGRAQRERKIVRAIIGSGASRAQKSTKVCFPSKSASGPSTPRAHTFLSAPRS